MLSWGVRWIFLGIFVGLVVLTVLLVVFLVPSGLHNEVGDEAELIVIRTQVGSIQGRKASDGDYYEFFGVPYALVNASNPFGASTPYPNFEETFVADDDTAICPQISNGEPTGSLNCLELNIVVPQSASNTNRLPVMVWIHGGGFQDGSKTNRVFGPKYLVKHDVIYVAITYRVGAYGFMCLDIPEVPGNQGLKDQVLALKWIKNNIDFFGGDVDKITVFGNSAGGHSIDFHILSDTEPLFNVAIIQSGSSLAATVFTNHISTAPIDIAAQLGFQTNSLYEAIEHLSSIHSDLVVQAGVQLNMVFKPCTEKKFDNVEPFLTRPWVTADTPKAKNMSILLGYCEHEMLLSYATPAHFENYNAISNRLQATFNFDTERFTAMKRNIRRFYFGDEEINYDMIWPAVNFDSDYTYIHPMHRSITKFLSSEAENVFLYKLTYNGNRNLLKVLSNVTIGTAVHADELGYLFNVVGILSETPTPEDQVILDRMTTMWTNFAKYRDPTPEISSLLPIRWPSITDESYNTFTIDTELAVVRRPTFNRTTYWDLFYKHNENYHKGIMLDQE